MNFINASLAVSSACALLFPTNQVSAETGTETKADWSKVRLYGHAYSNKGFTKEEYQFVADKAVSYTHLTLPTIYSV